MLRNLFLILIFLILNFISYTYLKSHYENNRNTLIDSQVQELNHLYQSAVTTFRLNAKAVFENIIMQPDVLEILNQLPNASNDKVDTLHNELYELLHKRYENLQNSLYVRQLHFHQTDGRSFLRMHRPKKYGDSLIGVRHSIYVANTQKNYIEGFEEGRIFNGYRYVYPIISDGVHLGSVEISVSISALIHQLSQIFKEKSFYFMIHKSLIDKKVFDSEKSNYSVSKIDSNYLVDNEVNSHFKQNYTVFMKKLNTQKINEQIENGTITAEEITVKGVNVIATFIPIANIEKNSISYMVSFEKNNYLSHIESEFFYQFLVSILIIFLGLGIAYYLLERSTRIVKLKKALDKLVEQRTQELEHVQEEKIQSYQDIILAMVNLTERRDTYTAGHTKRVAGYAKLIAKEMNYSKKDIQFLYEASILHDIGKIITPDSVLLKPGQLNNEEYEIIKQHVTTGEHILNDIALYKELVDIVRYHHERYDGSGYPYGLKGDEIPPLARVLAVADTFDAMTSNRIYKPRKDISIALDELKSLAGIHYDSKVVSAALKVLSDLTIDTTTSQLPVNELEVERLAHFYKDPLTGLHTVMYLELLLNIGINDVYYEYLKIISLKNFTKFNSLYGWESGNRALVQMAALLKKQYPDAIIFRVFGDDFMMLSQKVINVEKEHLQNQVTTVCEHPISFDIEDKRLQNKKDRDDFLIQLQTTH